MNGMPCVVTTGNHQACNCSLGFLGSYCEGKCFYFFTQMDGAPTFPAIWLAAGNFPLNVTLTQGYPPNFWIGSWKGKMGTGICLFKAGKMGFHALGMGFTSNKTLGNGNEIKIWAGQPLGRWNLCSWTLGFSQIWAGWWEWELPFKTLFEELADFKNVLFHFTVDVCASASCLNDATHCIRKASSYQCNCQEGYSGIRCESK